MGATRSQAGAPVLVVGAGIMGAGIAQAAAQAGHPVMLFYARAGAAVEAKAKAKLAPSLQALVAKGRLAPQAVQAALGRIEPIDQLVDAAAARVVDEAIDEQLAAKRALFQQREGAVAADCLLATNTSSISATAIANGLQHCGRLVGHDTMLMVTSSAYEACCQDKRYQPWPLQRETVDACLLGRKRGQGFYRYPHGERSLPVAVHAAPHTAGEVTVHGHGAIADALFAAATQALADQGCGPARDAHSGWTGPAIDGAHRVLTDGRCTRDWVAAPGSADAALFDRPLALLDALDGQYCGERYRASPWLLRLPGAGA